MTPFKYFVAAAIAAIVMAAVATAAPPPSADSADSVDPADSSDSADPTDSATSVPLSTASEPDAHTVDIVYELADLAFTRVVAHNCYEAYDSEKCDELSDMSAKDVRLYYGGMLANDTVMAILPDNDAQLIGKPHHDTFLVLDPFPAYKFGHPIFMFYVDFGVTVWKCEDNEGIYAGSYSRTLLFYHAARVRLADAIVRYGVQRILFINYQ